MRVYRWTGIDNRTLSYDDFFSLWLASEQATQADNFHTAVAVVVALGKGRMPAGWIEAAVEGTSGIHQWKNWDSFRVMGGD